MVMREISLYLVLGNLLIAAVGSTCVPVECLRCNVTGGASADSCALCPNNTKQCITDPSAIPINCKKDFQVSINSTGSILDEGDDITLTCVPNLLDFDLMFSWEKDKKKVPEGQNTSQLVLKKVLAHHGGQYVCFVKSPCGPYKSLPHDVTVKNNSVVLLVVCGVSALVLVVAMGLIMKFKLKRDNAKHKERMKQRAQAGQSGGPAALTPRES